MSKSGPRFPAVIWGRLWTSVLASNVLLIVLGLAQVDAMVIERTTWRDRPVLRLSGEIIAGDATRLKEELPSLPMWPHGAPVVLLDSVGGSVAEAMRISNLFDRVPVHAVVPQGARCASACASILFIAGRYRTIDSGGLLGQHSCSSNGIADSECNAALAEHAVAHGVSYGSVAAFVTYVAPENVAWHTRERADCLGLTKYPYERESGFEKSEPCVIELIAGRKPAAQSAWRIDFHENGYRAFLRPVHDDDREMELGLYCDNLKPGQLFLSMDIKGPGDAVRGAIVDVALEASPLRYTGLTPAFSDSGEGTTRLAITIGTADVLPFLKKADRAKLTARVRKPYVDLVAFTQLNSSRRALLFAANHCANSL